MKAITVEPLVADTARLEEIPEPALHEGSVLVEAIAVGVCGTDVEIVHGAYGWAPRGEKRLVLGHESLGRVLDPGPGGSLKEGDLVVGIVRRPDPVPCPNCAVGEWDMCRNGQYTERGIKEIHGFMSERWRIEPEYAMKVAPSLGILGVLLEPTTVVVKAWEQVLAVGHRAFWQPTRERRPDAARTCAGPRGWRSFLRARSPSEDPAKPPLQSQRRGRGPRWSPVHTTKTLQSVQVCQCQFRTTDRLPPLSTSSGCCRQLRSPRSCPATATRSAYRPGSSEPDLVVPAEAAGGVVRRRAHGGQRLEPEADHHGQLPRGKTVREHAGVRAERDRDAAADRFREDRPLGVGRLARSCAASRAASPRGRRPRRSSRRCRHPRRATCRARPSGRAPRRRAASRARPSAPRLAPRASRLQRRGHARPRVLRDRRPRRPPPVAAPPTAPAPRARCPARARPRSQSP